MDIEQIRAQPPTPSVFAQVAAVAVVIAIGVAMIWGAASLWGMLFKNDPLSRMRVDAMMAVQDRLKDGDSAKFDDLVASEQAVCGRVNARNSFGAYAGYTRFIYGPPDLVLLEESATPAVFQVMWSRFCLPELMPSDG